MVAMRTLGRVLAGFAHPLETSWRARLTLRNANALKPRPSTGWTRIATFHVKHLERDLKFALRVDS